jgi:hypothetical protein
MLHLWNDLRTQGAISGYQRDKRVLRGVLPSLFGEDPQGNGRISRQAAEKSWEIKVNPPARRPKIELPHFSLYAKDSVLW